MKTLVVYDTVFGNTEKIASAIGKALRADVKKVGEITEDALKGIGLLVVGSPTRAFKPTPAISGWIKGLPNESLKGVKVASFDTRISIEDVKSGFLRAMMKRFSYASKPILEMLVKKGGITACEPKGFIVMASEGPLKEGETGRAEEWAASLSPTKL